MEFKFFFCIFLVQFYWFLPIEANLQTPKELIQNDIAYFWDDQAEKDEEVNAIRNALKWYVPTNKLWDQHKDEDGRFVIQYYMENTISNYHSELIRDAMNAISSNTCIRFEDRDDVETDDLHKDWLYIMSPPVVNIESATCHVKDVGRQSGPNFVVLQHYDENRTCMTHKTIIHELFHKLGLWHEQSRYDRDHYITVNFENVIPEKANNFDIIGPSISNNYGVECDYFSVMHYDAKAFSKNDEETIIAKNSLVQNIIGMLSDASAGDYKKICSIYNCTRCMDKPFSTYAYNHCPVPKLPRYNSECHGRTPSNLFNYEEKCCTHEHKTRTRGVWAGDCTCKQCVPAENCHWTDSEYFPAHFASNCCGRCGAHWLRTFCRSRDATQLTHWQSRGMCPDDEDDTAVPVSQYSGECNYCIDCEPRSNCEGSDAEKYPHFYEQNCCGRCGNEYIRKWCQKLPSYKLRSWQEKGYCPDNVVPTTTTTTTTTTTSPPPTTTTPSGGVSPSVLDERRNCDLCSPDRPDCVTSNETYFTQECCWHCGREWFGSHCNHLALTSAINLKSSLYLFIWRKFDRCPMHELTPIAYRHFDGLDLNVDYKAAFCEHCKPKPDCETNFMKHFFARLQPHYYHRCCGYCSDSWQKQWCAKLVPSEKQLYRKFCPSNGN